MNKKIFNFDGYKFHQAMSLTKTNYAKENYGNFYGEDWELYRESRLNLASNDCQRMWRHLWQKMAIALKSR